LLRVGFTEPSRSPAALVRSYRTVSPSPVPSCPGHRRSILCGTVLHVTATRFASTLPCGAPTFLTARCRAARPPSRLTIRRPVWHSCAVSAMTKRWRSGA